MRRTGKLSALPATGSAGEIHRDMAWPIEMPRKGGILAAAPELALQDFAQLVALHLSGRGARQLGHGADPFWPLVTRQLLACTRGRPSGILVAARGDEKRNALQPLA